MRFLVLLFRSRVCRDRRRLKSVQRDKGKQMSHIQLYEQGEMDYGTDNFRRATELKLEKRNKPSHARRRGKAPQSINGIHRRRNRKLAW